MLSGLTFTSPLLLLALLGLPLLWWILRIMPPPARQVVFPPLAFLLGLKNEEETAHHTPLWLLILRLLIAGLIVLALAGPLLNPPPELEGEGPLVLVIDNGWDTAATWTERQRIAGEFLGEAALARRPVALVTTAPNLKARPALSLLSVTEAQGQLSSLEPAPWASDRLGLATWVEDGGLASLEGLGANIIWIGGAVSDGGESDLARALAGAGPVTFVTATTLRAPILLHPPARSGAYLEARLTRLLSDEPRTVNLHALNGRGSTIATAEANFGPGETVALAKLTLPVELQNTITRLEIEGERSAAATSLMDASWQRRNIGIATPGTGDIDRPLLSDAFYIDRATAPFAERQTGTLEDLLGQKPAAILLPDLGQVSDPVLNDLETWIESGGLLIRFAGPRLAARPDSLVAVPLRQGGRAFGGTLTWDEPQALAAFEDRSPFFGLAIPPDVTVSKQVLAEPSIELASHTWARLADGTPLVTARKIGNGWTIQFHITANPDWSTLPLSGLFVEMLERTIAFAASQAPPPPEQTEGGEAKVFPQKILTGYGEVREATGTLPGIAIKDLETWTATPETPPGLYERPGYSRALNLVGEKTEVKALSLPQGILQHLVLDAKRSLDLKPPLFVIALLLALIDGVALLIPSTDRGRLLQLFGRGAGLVLIAAVFVAASTSGTALAATNAEEKAALAATLQTHLAWVKTGNSETDRMSEAGLYGLTEVVRNRTAVEPGEPIGVDIETDDLTFFPLLFWPVSADQPMPSPKALEKLNRYMQTGGTIVFDTRDQEVQFGSAVGGGLTRNGAQLKEILTALNIPPLAQVPESHVLTKSFYLLSEFPGRWAGGKVWVESLEDSGLAGNPQTGSLNDGVSSVIIGSNDWLAAWATDRNGRPLAATVPGTTRQRELAYRFGVNIVMYSLTGNYKADQVHVPALLERLGERP